MPTTNERELADVFGGFDGGWSFWLAQLAAIEQAVARSRDREHGFSSAPRSELERFLYDVDAALRLGVAGVELQDLLNGDGRGVDGRELVADVLARRLAEVRAAGSWRAEGVAAQRAAIAAARQRLPG